LQQTDFFLVVKHGVGFKIHGEDFLMADPADKLSQFLWAADQVVGRLGDAVHIFLLTRGWFFPTFHKFFFYQ
jgi:hypothetical protein